MTDTKEIPQAPGFIEQGHSFFFAKFAPVFVGKRYEIELFGTPRRPNITLMADADLFQSFTPNPDELETVNREFINYLEFIRDHEIMFARMRIPPTSSENSSVWHITRKDPELEGRFPWPLVVEVSPEQETTVFKLIDPAQPETPRASFSFDRQGNCTHIAIRSLASETNDPAVQIDFVKKTITYPNGDCDKFSFNKMYEPTENSPCICSAENSLQIKFASFHAQGLHTRWAEIIHFPIKLPQQFQQLLMGPRFNWVHDFPWELFQFLQLANN